MIRAEAEARVEFYDVDSMGVVWHGHYVRFLELGRAALLDSLGYGYVRMRESGWTFPVVDLRVRYRKPARLGQRLTVSAFLKEWENRLVIDYEIRDAATGEKLTEAGTTQVAVRAGSEELSFASPPELLERVGRALRTSP